MTAPNHWNSVRLKQLVARIESGVSVNAVDVPRGSGELGVLKTSCVSQGWFDPDQNKTVNDEDLARVTCPVKPGRIIVSRMNTPQLVGAAGLVRTEVDDLFLPDRLWQVTVTSDVTAGFLAYWMQTGAYRGQVTSAGVGTSASMQNISQADFRDLILVIPPLPEQRAIADFLDRETTRIDTLIAEQQRLIDLLRERRQAAITCSTAGPGATRTPLVRCMTEQIDYRGATPTKTGTGTQLITARNVKPGWIDYETSEEYIDPDTYAEVMRRGLPRVNDLLFTMEAPLGNVALVDRVDIALAQRIIKWTVNQDRAVPRYLLYAILGDEFQYQLRARATGSTALGIKASKLPGLQVSLPPLDEQRRIATYLDEQTSKIDTLIAETEKFIELARERRSALITAAVTGQIDVRKSA